MTELIGKNKNLEDELLAEKKGIELGIQKLEDIKSRAVVACLISAGIFWLAIITLLFESPIWEISERRVIFFLCITLGLIGIVVFLFSLFTFTLRHLEVKRQRARIEDINFKKEILSYASEREVRAEQLLRYNDLQVRRYYELNIGENNWVKFVGLFCIFLGFIIFMATLIAVVGYAEKTDVQIVTALVGTLNSLLVNYIGSIYLQLHAKASRNFVVFHQRLVETNKIWIANLLVSSMMQDSDKLRSEVLSHISKSLVDGLVDDKSYSETQ